jgi:hypothetical protein
VLGGLNISSRSRALPKARGESQRGAGTATWSRVSCRMCGISRIHHPLGHLDKQPTERNNSDRQILRSWNFARPLIHAAEISDRSSGQTKPPALGDGVGEVAAVCHVAEPRSRQFWTSSHSASPRVRHATGQHIQLRITFRQLRLRDQPIIYSSSWKAPPLRRTILTELGGPECEVDHISEVTNVTARTGPVDAFLLGRRLRPRGVNSRGNEAKEATAGSDADSDAVEIEALPGLAALEPFPGRFRRDRLPRRNGSGTI